MEKINYSLQFLIKSVPESLLWTYISSAEGLREWFAGDVKIVDKKYYFSWEGAEHRTASVVDTDNESFISFRWDDDAPDCIWSLSISVLDLTDDTVLTVTDNALPEDLEGDKELWEAQVDELRHTLGC